MCIVTECARKMTVTFSVCALTLSDSWTECINAVPSPKQIECLGHRSMDLHLCQRLAATADAMMRMGGVYQGRLGGLSPPPMNPQT